jgi:hypothetical protein
MMNMGIDLADVVKVPRTRTIREITIDAVEGSKVPVWDFLLKPHEPTQQLSRKYSAHLHVRNLLVLVQEVVHVEFAR